MRVDEKIFTMLNNDQPPSLSSTEIQNANPEDTFSNEEEPLTPQDTLANSPSTVSTSRRLIPPTERECFPDGTEFAFKEFIEARSRKYFTTERYDEICAILTAGPMRLDPSISSKEKNKIYQERHRLRRQFTLRGRSLYKITSERLRLVALKDSAFDIIFGEHVYFHEGEYKHNNLTETNKRVQQMAYGIPSENVKWLIDLCEKCHPAPTPSSSAVPLDVDVEKVFDRLQIDIVDVEGSESESFKYVLILRDHLSNFTSLSALKDKCAGIIARCIWRYSKYNGPPKVLQFDPNEDIHQAILMLLNSKGMRISIGQSRGNDVAWKATCVKRFVQSEIRKWKQLHPHLSWQLGLLHAERCINTEGDCANPSINPFAIIYGPQRSEHIEKTEQLRQWKVQRRGPTLQQFIDNPSLAESSNLALERGPDEIRAHPRSTDLDSLEQVSRECVSSEFTGLPSSDSLHAPLLSAPGRLEAIRAYQVITRDKMATKYSYHHNIRKFKPGEYVTVQFHKDVRPSLAQLRFYAKILEVIGEKNYMYRVLTEFGELNNKVLTSQMNAVPSEMWPAIANAFVDTPLNVVVAVTLVASRMSTSGIKVIVCNCKKGCRTGLCYCKKNKVKCSQYCHDECFNKGTVLEGTEVALVRETQQP